MPPSIRLHRTRPACLAIIAAASVVFLGGCTAEAPRPTATAAPTASETPAATEPAPTETAEPPVPFTIECDALLTPQNVYDFNPNFGADPDYEPSAEGITGIVEEAGTACGWLNQTSGELIEVGVATPPPSALEARKNAAALDSTPVPTYGTPPDVEGYFVQSDSSGEAQVFQGPYWIVIDSSSLFEPGDAQLLVTAVLGNLPDA